MQKKTFFTHNFGIKIPWHKNWKFYDLKELENTKQILKKCVIFFSSEFK